MRTSKRAAHKREAGRTTAKVRVVAMSAASAQICQRSLGKLPPRWRARFELQQLGTRAAAAMPSRRAGLLYVSRLADLPPEGARKALAAAGRARHLVLLEGLPVEALAARLLPLDIRNPHRLHVAATRSKRGVAEITYRLFSGIAQTDGPGTIVDCWVEGDRLVVLSPAFDRLSVPLDDLAPLIGTDRDQVAAFEIDEDGRFLHWPHADVHLGWDQLVQIVDPAAALAARQSSEAFNRRYGAAIRALREECGLRQSDITGLTERHLRRVEQGQQAATRATLDALATAHALTLGDYLKQLAERLARSARS